MENQNSEKDINSTEELIRDDNVVTKKSWNEFRKSGLLLFINQILHVFGWAIVVKFENYDEETDDGEITDVYPARVKYRGFAVDLVSKSYLKISKYLSENITELLDEAKK